jgi:hypothetical protein
MTHLDEWARYLIVTQNAPGSNYSVVLLKLCMAIEAELAAGLGAIATFSFLRKVP